MIMLQVSRISWNWRGALLPAAWFCVMGYFAYHALSGDEVFSRWSDLNQDIETLETDVAQAAAERAALERKVDALDRESMDRDLLDEEARRKLGLARPDEIVIYTPEE